MDAEQAENEVMMDILKRQLKETERRYEEALDAYLAKKNEEPYGESIKKNKFNYLVILKQTVASFNEQIDNRSFKDIAPDVDERMCYNCDTIRKLNQFQSDVHSICNICIRKYNRRHGLSTELYDPKET